MLRQLVAWVGDEAFLAGLRAHFAAHAFGNATLADLLAALSRGQRRDLAELGAGCGCAPAQVNTLRAEVTWATRRPRTPPWRSADRAGGVPDAAPAPDRPRPGYDVDDAGVLRSDRAEVDLDPATRPTGVPALPAQPAAELLLLNDGDLTYAKVRLRRPRRRPPCPDPAAARRPAGPRGGLGARWTPCATPSGRSTEPGRAAGAALPAETEVAIVEDGLLRCAATSVEPLPRPADAAGGGCRVRSARCGRLLVDAPPGRAPASSPRPAGLISTRRPTRTAAGLARRRGLPDGPGGRRRPALARSCYRLVGARRVDRASEIDAELAARPQRDGRAVGGPMPGRAARPGGQARRLARSSSRTRRCPTGWWRPRRRASGSRSRRS